VKTTITKPAAQKKQDKLQVAAHDTGAQKEGGSDAEYSVYIYHHAEDLSMPPRWEKKHSTYFVDQAIKRAKILYKSEKYAKVEVKKKSIHRRTHQAIDKTYKVFSCHGMPFYMHAEMIAAAALGLVGLGVFLYLALVA